LLKYAGSIKLILWASQTLLEIWQNLYYVYKKSNCITTDEVENVEYKSKTKVFKRNGKRVLKGDCCVLFGVMKGDREWGLAGFLGNVIPLIVVRLKDYGC